MTHNNSKHGFASYKIEIKQFKLERLNISGNIQRIDSTNP